MAADQVGDGFVADVIASYRPPGNPTSPKEVEWIRNTDGSVLLDHNGRPISVAKLLATKPLRQELSSRPGPGNKKLTYLSGEGVTRTLNEVFGFDGWNLEIKQTTREECVKDEKGRFHVAYTATVRLTHRRSGAYKEDCGAGDAIDRSMGTAIAHGLKASITDAMKRAARHFGDKLGNSLYQGSFTFNKAPMTLKQALDQYDINRANTKFGVQTNPVNPVGMKSEALIKSETSNVPPADPHTTNVGPPKQPLSAQRHVANGYPKMTTSMPPPSAQTSQERATTLNVSAVSRPSAPIQKKVSPYPMKTPKAGPSAVSLVTPNTSNAPPTPGQRLQSGQLFGLGQYAAGKPSFSFDADSENQPPASVDGKRPGTSTGLQEQRAGVGPFAGRQAPGGANKRPLEHVGNQHVPQKKANVTQMPVQKRNPYASS